VILAFGLTNCPSSGQGHGHVMFKFWEIIDNILEMVEGRDIVSVED